MLFFTLKWIRSNIRALFFRSKNKKYFFSLLLYISIDTTNRYKLYSWKALNTYLMFVSQEVNLLLNLTIFFTFFFSADGLLPRGVFVIFCRFLPRNNNLIICALSNGVLQVLNISTGKFNHDCHGAPMLVKIFFLTFPECF